MRPDKSLYGAVPSTYVHTRHHTPTYSLTLMSCRRCCASRHQPAHGKPRAQVPPPALSQARRLRGRCRSLGDLGLLAGICWIGCGVQTGALPKISESPAADGGGGGPPSCGLASVGCSGGAAAMAVRPAQGLPDLACCVRAGVRCCPAASDGRAAASRRSALGQAWGAARYHTEV